MNAKTVGFRMNLWFCGLFIIYEWSHNLSRLSWAYRDASRALREGYKRYIVSDNLEKLYEALNVRYQAYIEIERAFLALQIKSGAALNNTLDALLFMRQYYKK